MTNLTAEKRAEGFAFFAWHRLRWSDGCCSCHQHPDYVCYRAWRAYPLEGRSVTKHERLSDVLSGIQSATSPQDLEQRFRATFDRWRAWRTKDRIRDAVTKRGRELCAQQDPREFIPRFDTRTRRLHVCGETYRVEHGGNSTGVRYAWHYAYQWMEGALRKNGCSPKLIEQITEWWRTYPHRALRALMRCPRLRSVR